MLLIFQILFILFALFAIANVLGKKREGLLGPKGTLFWILFWFIAGVVVIWPNSVQQIANNFGIGRGVDFVMYIAFALIFFILFRLHVKFEELKRDVTKVVRGKALKE
ncbi:DUF2304 domain-containing protein [Candidatus Parcubacteria bacterium]|jgi:small membrane protein|nr:DUF2304 domain-containing protein [Candidatus Parcubacteria bacterium]MBT3948941.1 DUF2304 domain-containing protein [Candidatus Parcubacteria bacterium]